MSKPKKKQKLGASGPGGAPPGAEGKKSNFWSWVFAGAVLYAVTKKGK